MLFKKYTAYDPPPTRGHLSLKGFAKLLEGTGLYSVASLTPKTVALTLTRSPSPNFSPNRTTPSLSLTLTLNLTSTLTLALTLTRSR